MAVFFKGNHNCITFGQLRLWAERGMIRCVDQRTGQYDVYSVRTTLHRLQALQDMLANSRKDGKVNAYIDNPTYLRIQRMIEQMVDVCQRARVQGMPSDPTAVRDLHRRRPKTFVVPSLGAIM